ncbi:MAG: toll/interleukin-1 receptor domain-containing protein [Ruminiclostridium sp.]|nr:toll/interleukin-1 receptor domain-containing protein [Ruminiclostridium sp.]
MSTEQIKVFFSYGHDRHGEIVKRLADTIERLSENKIQVWIDHKSIPRDSHWRKEIQEGIYNCNSVLAFLSEYSARDKGVCLDEIAIALVSKHGMIRTVLLEPADSFTPPTMVSEYQWGDMSDYPDALKKGEEAFSTYIERQAMQIIKLVSSDEIMQYSADIKELRRRLAMPERDRMTRFDLLLQKDMTERTWLDSIVKQWIEDEKGSKILMLYGKPGAGKSMYCANLQHYNPRVVASISCDHQSNSFSNTDDIIRYLAYKLALRLPDYRSGLIRLLKDEGFTMKSGKDLFDDLIGQPLGKIGIDGHRDNMIICIDALDESKTDELAGFLAEYQAYMRDWVRFLITSRKEPNIVSRFESFRAIDLDEYTEQTSADMTSYFHRRLDEKLSGFENRDEFIARLTEAGENVFTYAECICDNITEDIDLGKVKELTLYPIPKGIQSLFANTLDRKFGSTGAPYTLREYEELWQEPLGMIIASETPLPIATLKQLMSWRNNQLRKFRSPLSTLLTESDGYLQAFHRSFGEWLDKEGTPYYSSVEDGISALAERILEQYETDTDSLDEYMLLNLTKLLRKAGMKKEYKEVTEDMDYIQKLFDTLKEYIEKNRFDDAIKLAEELITIFSEDTDDEKKLYNLSESYFSMGQVLMQVCRYDDSLEYFARALEIDKKLTESYPDNAEYLRSYTASLIKTADIYTMQNCKEKALDIYNEVLDLTKSLSDDHPDKPDYQFRYSVSLDRVAGIYESQNNFSDALRLFDEALAINKRLAEDYPDVQKYLHGHSSLLNKIAGIYEMQSRFNEAIELHREALVISKKLADQYPEKPDHIYDYSVSLERVADALYTLGQTEEAIKLYKEETEILGKLVDGYPENPDYLFGYSISLEREADICEEQGDLEEALKQHNERRRILKSLCDSYPENNDYPHSYSSTFTRIAYIREIQGDLEEAAGLYGEASVILKKLTDSYPTIPAYQYSYAIGIERIADVCEKQGDHKKALKLFTEETEIFRGLSESYPEKPDYLYNYSIALERLADCYLTLNKARSAYQLYKENTEVSRNLYESFPENPDYLRRYALSFDRTADICEQYGKYNEALKQYWNEVRSFKTLTESFPKDPGYMRCYAIALNRTAAFYEAQSQLNKALRLYREGAKIFKSLCDSYPENPDNLKAYYVPLLHIGGILIELGREEKGKRYVLKARAICNSILQRYPDDDMVRERLETIDNVIAKHLA